MPITYFSKRLYGDAKATPFFGVARHAISVLFGRLDLFIFNTRDRFILKKCVAFTAEQEAYLVLQGFIL